MNTNAEEQPEISLNETPLKRTLDVLDVIGGHGPWQFRLWIAFLAATLCNSVVLFSVLFLPSQSFCFLSNYTASLSQINGSTASSSPQNYVGHNVASHVPANCNSPNCTSSSTNSSESKDTLSKFFYHTECSNSQVEILAKCIYVIACAISVPLVYFLSKRFGQRPVTLVSCLFLVTSSVAGSFADAASVFLILRFIISLAIFNVYLISAYSLVKYVHKYFKILYFLTGHIGWGLAHFFLPLVSSLTEDWMSFNLALSIVCIFVLLLVWWSPESPSSFSNGGNQLARSRKALKYAAFTNGYSTTDVDLLPHGSNLRQENTCELQTPTTSKEKMLLSLYSCILFLLSFSTTFIYFSTKWNTEWFKVRSNRLSFSFVGTTEIAAAIILLFLSCLLAIKHLWSCVSAMTSVLMIVIYTRSKPTIATSSAKLFTITVFFSAAGWTLLAMKIFCNKTRSTMAKRNLIVTAVAVFIGALTASSMSLNVNNQNLLLMFAVPHLILGICLAFLPDHVFGTIE